MPSLKPSLEGRHDHKHYQGEIFIYTGSGGWKILLASSTYGKTLERLEAQVVLNGEVPTWWVSTSDVGNLISFPTLDWQGKVCHSAGALVTSSLLSQLVEQVGAWR